MTLKSKLTNDLKEAMKNKDKDLLSLVRMLKAAVSNAEIEFGHELTEQEELSLLAKEVKQRKESLAEYTAGNRDDLAQKTKFEIDILENNYLPKQLTDEEVETIVKKAISETGASGMKDMGKVMSLVTKETTGRADGKLVSEKVKSLLNS